MLASSHCTWFPWCTRPVAREVERRTADGVVLRELVCDRHLANARDHGFVPVPDADDAGDGDDAGDHDGHDGAAAPTEPAGRDEGRGQRPGP